MINPPTDNLYKFRALSGVAILIATAVLIDHRLADLESRQSVLAEEIAVLQVESADWHDRSADLAKQRKQLAAVRDEVKRYGVDVAKKAAILDVKLGTQRRLLRDVAATLWIGIPFSVIAALLSIVGFRDWKRQLQEKEDLKMEYEVELKRLEVNEKRLRAGEPTIQLPK